MSRDLPLQLEAGLSSPVIYPFFAIELLFDDNPVRVWTGVGTLSLGGFDWVGSGQLITVSAIEETQEMSVKGATITMSGIPSELLSLALSEPYQGRVCNIYFGATTPANESVYGVQGFEPEVVLDFTNGYFQGEYSVESNQLSQIFSGYMDQMNIVDGPETSTIELLVENKLIDLERARIARYTSGYQKSVYPGDLGLDFVESLQDKDIVWGRSSGG